MVAPCEQLNAASLLDSPRSTAFTMSIFRRLHEYSGSTGTKARNAHRFDLAR